MNDLGGRAVGIRLSQVAFIVAHALLIKAGKCHLCR